MNEIKIDRYDLLLLAALQRDGHATNAALGERANLSASQISRRIQRLEEAGVVTGYMALLDSDAIGLGVMAYAQIVLDRHDTQRGGEFERAVAALPQVVECFAVTGESDYMLRIVSPDLAAFSELVMKRVVRLPGVVQVKTNIALSKVKQTHELPLDHLTSSPKQGPRVTFTG